MWLDRTNPRPDNALQLTVNGHGPINHGKVWHRASALRSATAAALVGS
jgi:hypothetical protein